MRVNLNYHDVEKLFEDSKKEPILELYRMVFPDFDKMEKIDGWPTINTDTSLRLCRLYQSYDRKHSPDSLVGGAWLNWGFSSLEGEKLGLKNWEVETSTCNVIYKDVDKYLKGCPACEDMKTEGLTFEETHSSRKCGYLETDIGWIKNPHEGEPK